MLGGPLLPFIPAEGQWIWTDLKLGVALVEQNVHNGQLADVAVLLKLLADLCANGRNGHVQRIHGLDLRGL